MKHHQETHVHPAKKRGWKILIAIAALGGTILVLEAIVHLASIRAGLSLQALPADHMSREYIEHLMPALAHLVPGIAFLILSDWPENHELLGGAIMIAGISIPLLRLGTRR